MGLSVSFRPQCANIAVQAHGHNARRQSQAFYGVCHACVHLDMQGIDAGPVVSVRSSHHAVFTRPLSGRRCPPLAVLAQPWLRDRCAAASPAPSVTGRGVAATCCASSRLRFHSFTLLTLALCFSARRAVVRMDFLWLCLALVARVSASSPAESSRRAHMILAHYLATQIHDDSQKHRETAIAGRCRVRPQKGPGTLAGDCSRASGGTQGGLNGGGRVAKRPIPVARGVVRGAML